MHSWLTGWDIGIGNCVWNLNSCLFGLSDGIGDGFWGVGLVSGDGDSDGVDRWGLGDRLGAGLGLGLGISLGVGEGLGAGLGLGLGDGLGVFVVLILVFMTVTVAVAVAVLALIVVDYLGAVLDLGLPLSASGGDICLLVLCHSLDVVLVILVIIVGLVVMILDNIGISIGIVVWSSSYTGSKNGSAEEDSSERWDLHVD